MAIEQTGVRIAELQEVTELTNNDEFIVETPGGTRRINKENLAEQIGGDFSDKLLSDMEELEANTDEGFLADALIVKKIVNNVKIYVKDGKLHYVDPRGADTVINFSFADLAKLKLILLDADIGVITNKYTFYSYRDTQTYITTTADGININITYAAANGFLGNFAGAINVTDYKKLRVKYKCNSSNNYIYMGFSNTRHTNFINSPVLNNIFVKYMTVNNGVNELDISDLSGNYYLEFISNTVSKAVENDIISLIELEK